MAAKTDLCGQFKLAMDAVRIETNGPDAGFGHITLINGTPVLESATANSAWGPTYRDAARAVESAYQDLVIGFSSGKADDPQFDNVVNTANAKERVLKDLCGD